MKTTIRGGACLLLFALASLVMIAPQNILGETGEATFKRKFKEAHSTLEVLETSEIESLKGKTRIHIIRPPAQLKLDPAEAKLVADKSPEWFGRSVLGGGSKEVEQLQLSVTVYDRKASQLELRLGEQTITAHSGIDGNLLNQISHLETEDTIYLVAPFIQNIDLALLRKRIQGLRDRGLLTEGFEEPAWLSTLERSEDSYISEFTTPDTTGVFGLLMEHLLHSYADEVVRMEESAAQLESLRVSRQGELPKTDPHLSEPEIFMWPKSNSGYQQYSKRRDK